MGHCMELSKGNLQSNIGMTFCYFQALDGVISSEITVQFRTVLASQPEVLAGQKTL